MTTATARALLENARYDPIANARATTLTRQGAPSSVARLAATNVPAPKTPSSFGHPRSLEVAAATRKLRMIPPCA
eukprot:11193868-Lingulodinium_polyedra.AAC.1